MGNMCMEKNQTQEFQVIPQSDPFMEEPQQLLSVFSKGSYYKSSKQIVSSKKILEDEIREVCQQNNKTENDKLRGIVEILRKSGQNQQEKIINDFKLKNTDDKNIYLDQTGEFGLQKIDKDYFYLGNFKSNQKEGIGLEIKKNYIIFIGNWIFGKKNGYAIRLLNNDNEYRGEYKNDKKNGYGKLFIKDKYIIEGYFKDGQLNEEMVTIRYPNKVIYKGEIQEQKLNGIGKFIFSNGSVFSGTFLKNIVNGPCKYEVDDLYFKANFINGIPEGKGQIYIKKNNKLQENIQWDRSSWESKTGLSLEYINVNNFD